MTVLICVRCFVFVIYLEVSYPLINMIHDMLLSDYIVTPSRIPVFLAFIDTQRGFFPPVGVACIVDVQ